MKDKAKVYRTYGLLGVASFAAMLILLLLTLGFTTPLPLPAEEGILINFGDGDDGLGEVEPSQNDMAQPEPATSEPEEVTAQDQPAEAVASPNEEIITQDFEEAPAEESASETPAPKEQEATKQEKTEPKKEERKVNAKALFPGKSQNDNNTSEGETSGEGNQGSVTGSEASDNHTGGSSTGGKGIDFSLAGRNPEALPKPVYNYQEEGKVVVEITVDKFGRVTKANPGVKGSTTLNKNLLDAAKKAALQAKFDKKPDAPAYQNGTITYYFKLK